MVSQVLGLRGWCFLYTWKPATLWDHTSENQRCYERNLDLQEINLALIKMYFVFWFWSLEKVNAFKTDFPDNTWFRSLISPASLEYLWEYNNGNTDNESEHVGKHELLTED